MRNRTVTKGDILLKFLPSNLREKFKETLKAVLPIIAIVLVLCFTIAPISPSIILMFLVGGVLLIMGMLLFNVGVDISMTPMGERVGTTMTKSKNIFIMIALSFLLGVMITISEPDLQVLAGQVPSIPNMVLILTVAVGVGFFLVLALVRMLFGIQLSHMLLVFYAVVFTLAYFAPGDFLAVAFDSGGVTTGPMTVPFIMALGVGISAIRSDKRAADDSFGLVALCSIGPILAVLVLSMIYRPDVNAMSTGSEPIQIMDDTVQMWRAFMEEFPAYMKEIAISLLPIIVFFFLFQLIS